MSTHEATGASALSAHNRRRRRRRDALNSPQLMVTHVPYGQPYGSNQPQQPPQPMMKISSNSDNGRTTNERRLLDCNLASLCDDIQSEGFDSGAFSDIAVQAMG